MAGILHDSPPFVKLISIFNEVASILLCKIFEWVKGPLIIHAFEDGIENSFTAGASGKGTHFSDAPADLDKEPFDDISGTNTFPMLPGTVKDG